MRAAINKMYINRLEIRTKSSTRAIFIFMKASIHRLLILIMGLHFSYFLIAWDKKPELQDSSLSVLKGKDLLYLKNAALIKNDTLKKPAPSGSSDSTAPTPSHLELSLTWLSNDVTNGRKDSTVIPLITPKISYIFKSGFEIDLSVGYNTHEPSPQVNQYTLDGSYTFNPGNYSGTVTLSGFIYSKQSGSTTAEQKGSLEYDNSYDLNFIQPGVNLTWTFNNGLPDYQASPSIQHQYSIGNLNITPTATMNAATQNAYNSYYMNRRFSIPRPGKPPLPANVTISGEVLNASKFQILDYELSSPFSYTAAKWTFGFTPTYAMPVNPADIKLSVQVDNNIHSYTYKETLPNTFYVQLSITYDF
jgi:hypothetical protein